MAATATSASIVRIAETLLRQVGPFQWRLVHSLRSSSPKSPRCGDCLSARPDAQLAAEVREVEPHSLVGDPHDLRDLVIRVGLCGQGEDLELATRDMQAPGRLRPLKRERLL